MSKITMPPFGTYLEQINGSRFEIVNVRGFEQIFIYDESNLIISEITIPNRIKGTVKMHDLKRSFPSNHPNEYYKANPLKVGDTIYNVYTHPDGGKSLSEFTIAGIF